MAQRELLFQRLRELHAYVRVLGEHITYIHNQVQRIESDLNTQRNEQTSAIEANTNELTLIKETMLTTSEVDDFVRVLNDIIQEVFPSLPTISPAS